MISHKSSKRWESNSAVKQVENKEAVWETIKKKGLEEKDN